MKDLFKEHGVEIGDILVIKDRTTLYEIKDIPPFVADEMLDKADCLLHVTDIATNSNGETIVISSDLEYYCWISEYFRKLIIRDYRLLLWWKLLKEILY